MMFSSKYNAFLVRLAIAVLLLLSSSTLSPSNENVSPTMPPQLGVPWWDLNWPYARPLTIATGANAPLNRYAGYSVHFNLDTTDASRFLSNCDDVRIIYWNGIANIEVDRFVYDCNTATTSIWFQLQADIADTSSDLNYFLYYGNLAAINPPNDPLNVYLWWDDFSSN